MFASNVFRSLKNHRRVRSRFNEQKKLSQALRVIIKSLITEVVHVFIIFVANINYQYYLSCSKYTMSWSLVITVAIRVVCYTHVVIEHVDAHMLIRIQYYLSYLSIIYNATFQ